MIKKCPGCGTSDKKKFSIEEIGKSFKAKCICGYEHKPNEKIM